MYDIGGSKGAGMSVPSGCNFFIFIEFWGKIGQNRAPPFWLAPSLLGNPGSATVIMMNTN